MVYRRWSALNIDYGIGGPAGSAADTAEMPAEDVSSGYSIGDVLSLIVSLVRKYSDHFTRLT